MADEFRNLYSEPYIAHIAQCLFEEGNIDKDDFIAFTFAPPWNEMTLKQRMWRLTEGLTHFLPGSFSGDITILKRLLPRVSGSAQKYADMLSMFVPDYVISKGKQDLGLSLDALAHFTSHGTSSEFAIRPLILQNPDPVMARMLAWASDENENVRRFASEGCRPRLPWAMALPEFKKDPTLILPILERLKTDSSKFVQQSVANNLNDIAKDNPDIVLEFADKWLGHNANTDWIIKHGCRTLLKQGNLTALSLFGSDPVTAENSRLTLVEDQVSFGQSLKFSFEAHLSSELPENLRIEYAVDFMKANGKLARKIFKISEKKPASQKVAVSKSHKFVDYSTRKHYGGTHGIAILLNGQEVSYQSFILNK